MWFSISSPRRELELSRQSSGVKKAWLKIQKEFSEEEAAAAPSTATQVTIHSKPPVSKRPRRSGKVIDEVAAVPTAHVSLIVPPAEAPRHLEADFFPSLLAEFFSSLETLTSPVEPSMLEYCEHFLSLVVDLLSQLTTRRFLKALLEDCHFLQRAGECGALVGEGVSFFSTITASNDSVQASVDAASEPPRLYSQLLSRVDFFLGFEVDEGTGEALSESAMDSLYFSRIAILQRLAFTHFSPSFPPLKEFALGSIGLVSQPSTLRGYLEALPDASLIGLSRRLRLLPLSDWKPPGSKPIPPLSVSRESVLTLLLLSHRRRKSQLKSINSLPLYPSEGVLWDPNLVPQGSHVERDGVARATPLPKLNLQFLTLYDYLLRSFQLYRLESAYEIRVDIVEALKRRVASKWLLDIEGGVAIKDIAPPLVGCDIPSRVAAECRFSLARVPTHVRAEWDALREHDSVFFVTLNPPSSSIPISSPSAALSSSSPSSSSAIALKSIPDEEDFTFPSRFGVLYVRGATVEGLFDEKGRRLGDEGVGSKFPVDSASGVGGASGHRRTLRVLLDPAQYAVDCPVGGTTKQTRVYETLNILIRRDPKTNNFRSVLEAIRDALNVSAGAPLLPSSSLNFGPASSGSGSGLSSTNLLPDWLSDNLLGYGDPKAVNYRSLPSQQQVDSADWGGVFLSPTHLRSCFPKAQVIRFMKNAGTGPGGFGQEIDLGKNAAEAAAAAPPPYRLRFLQSSSSPSTAKKSKSNTGICDGEIVLAYPYDNTREGGVHTPGNVSGTVPFTPTQVEALRSSLNKGLTLVVGPPGTGKTDTACAAISLLLKNFPSSRILLVTHSNAALNDLFEKLLAWGCPARHLLRLGVGERDLEVEGDFSKAGRVDAALGRRRECLALVEKLSASLGVPGEGYTCETAEHFYKFHVLERIQKWRKDFGLPHPPPIQNLETNGASTGTYGDSEKSSPPAPPAPSTHATLGESRRGKNGGVASSPTVLAASPPLSAYTLALQEGAAARAVYLASLNSSLASVSTALLIQSFPFTNFFAAYTPGGMDAALPSQASTLDTALAIETCFSRLIELFTEVASCKAFEVLRTWRSRLDYLLLKEARVIALTTTHAAIIRPRLISLGFHYDTVVMEEAGQVTEVESFIPLVCQSPHPVSKVSPLARVVLLGDHHQLPPVIQNATLARSSGLDQSMFLRLVRLGVPVVMLDAQGRSRPCLSDLWRWRYPAGLGDLPCTAEGVYKMGNAGFAHNCCVVDVGDHEGKGETCPYPHAFQNQGEAEYMVSVYQYMRLLGYPSSSIALLTTYNGQKDLLRELVRRRCASNPRYGSPAAIETVDKFQGQQAPYVLLSLVRTRGVGHIRDVRRLVVALSRGRLGLYIFARSSLFGGVPELAPAWKQLTSRSSLSLDLLIGEAHPCSRPQEETIEGALVAAGGLVSHVCVKGVKEMASIVTTLEGIIPT